MKLSGLQKFILLETLAKNQTKVPRQVFDKFYEKTKNPPREKIRTNIITKSIERIIDRGLAIGYGEKTQYKLFISHIKLSPKGKKTALGLLGKQTQFKFKNRKK